MGHEREGPGRRCAGDDLLKLGVRRGDVPNVAEIALLERAKDRRLLARVKVGDVAVVETFDAKRGRVDVKRKMDTRSRTIYDLPILGWDRHRWPLEKGDLGFLHHTHDDSSGAYESYDRKRAATPGTHTFDTPVFDPRGAQVTTDALHALFDEASTATDYREWGPDDEIWFLEGGSCIIVKSGGDITFVLASGAKLRVGASTHTAMQGVSKILGGSSTWDPGSLAHGASASTTITVTGAASGDRVLVSHTAAPAGTVLFANVTSANTVTITLLNASGGTLDVASGTLTVTVIGG